MLTWSSAAPTPPSRPPPAPRSRRPRALGPCRVRERRGRRGPSPVLFNGSEWILQVAVPLDLPWDPAPPYGGAGSRWRSATLCPNVSLLEALIMRNLLMY